MSALIPGLKFVVRYKLSVGEAELYAEILSEPMTMEQLANKTNKQLSNTSRIVRTLQMKSLVTHDHSKKRVYSGVESI